MGYSPQAKFEIENEQWYIIDAKDRVLGQIAADIATVLRGKHMPTYTPHANMQTHVIVLNADKVHLTGDKWRSKMYYDHSLWRGGLRSQNAKELNQRHPGDLVRRAVWGMLPKGRLGRHTMTRLRLFTGTDHPHEAQRPIPMPTRTSQAEASK